MVDQTNIFEGENTPAETKGEESTQALELPEIANEFIGEGKKYAKL